MASPMPWAPAVTRARFPVSLLIAEACNESAWKIKLALVTLRRVTARGFRRWQFPSENEQRCARVRSDLADARVPQDCANDLRLARVHRGWPSLRRKADCRRCRRRRLASRAKRRARAH